MPFEKEVEGVQFQSPGRSACPVEAVLLDAAGTLISPVQPVGETYAAVAKQFGVELDPDTLAHAFVAVLGDMPALAFDWVSRKELHCRELDWWRTLVGRVVGSTGARFDDFEGFFETLYRYYERSIAWESFPDVYAVLRALKAGGFKLAVVSNFDSRLPGILQDLGIVDLVDAVVYSSEAGSAKPDPLIFNQALAALGVTAERAIHVGDSLQADIRGAAAAGIEGLLIRRGYASAVGSESVIRSLEELLLWVDGGYY
jgi:putative hydrolase of the HAD superfamily